MTYKDGVIVSLTKVINGNPVHLAASGKIMDALIVADRISKSVTGKAIVVTSLLDGVHSKNSLHYSGNAFDLRVWIYTQDQIQQLLKRFKTELGNDFDCIFEGDHFHIEYDPK